MSKILITGGGGLIGTWLKKCIPEATYVCSSDFDLTNQNQVEKMFSEHKPEKVVHLAAKVGGILDNINHPVSHLDDNLLMNTLTLKYAHMYGVKRFLTVLSYTMYPSENKANKPFTEDLIYDGVPHESIFSYAMVKRVMATQIQNYNKEYGTKYNYLIPCNLYGPTDKEDKIIPVIINKVKKAIKNKEKKIVLFGDGTPIRQFMYAEDFANIIKEVLERDITESFNVAPSTSYTIESVAKMIISMSNSDLKIQYDPSKPNGQKKRDVDVEKFKKMIPDYKFISLYDGIKKCYEY
jgi:GDP-L-fucose synthase